MSEAEKKSGLLSSSVTRTSESQDQAQDKDHKDDHKDDHNPANVQESVGKDAAPEIHASSGTAASEEPALFAAEGMPPTASTQPTQDQQAPYRVLARKYRPRTFADLIGQDVLVRTLSHAIENKRLAHAYILTGVRGVGKTTTARILARAINYAGPQGTSGPTTAPTDDCAICQAIAEDRHPDVLEMDAASRTGVGDIRELIESVRYRPVSARYKVYIIDEVHMLSNSAFNALLKTLEEPPEHVIFIFATTEIRKLPVTVLSRCQRFDLRRVEQGELITHFAAICEKEGVAADEEALALIARAADGSVRDGLSLLDQAIARAQDRIESAEVKAMLGLADRERVYDLYEEVMKGNVPAALDMIKDLYNAGADPLTVIQDMLELTHRLTRLKLVAPSSEDKNLTETERTRGRDMASRLSMSSLAQTWQMLLKGLSEIMAAPVPLQAAEMLIIRLAYASDLPTPQELIKRLKKESESEEGDGGGGQDNSTASGSGGEGGKDLHTKNMRASAVAPQNPSGQPLAITGTRASGKQGEPASALSARPSHPLVSSALASHSLASSPLPWESLDAPLDAPLQEKTLPAAPPPAALSVMADPQDFHAVAALFRGRKEARLSQHLYYDVHLVSFSPQRIEFRPTDKAPKDLAGQVARYLEEWTGKRWIVTISREGGDPSLGEQEDVAAQESLRRAASHPLVQKAQSLFAGTSVKKVHTSLPTAVLRAMQEQEQVSLETAPGEFTEGEGYEGSRDEEIAHDETAHDETAQKPE